MRDKLDEDIKIQNSKNEWKYEYKGVKIIIRKGDIAEEFSTAIVNPVDEYLLHEGGIAKTIADKAGDYFIAECHNYINKNGKLSTGSTMITSAGGALCCDMVIHTVGPKYKKGAPDNSLAENQLRSCINSILKIAKENDIKSISIPAISTGVFNFPAGKCARIIGNSIKNEIDSSEPLFGNKEFIFCNNNKETTDWFLKCIPQIFVVGLKESVNDEKEKKKSEKQKYEETKDEYKSEISSDDHSEVNYQDFYINKSKIRSKEQSKIERATTIKFYFHYLLLLLPIYFIFQHIIYLSD